MKKAGGEEHNQMTDPTIRVDQNRHSNVEKENHNDYLNRKCNTATDEQRQRQRQGKDRSRGQASWPEEAQRSSSSKRSSARLDLSQPPQQVQDVHQILPSMSLLNKCITTQPMCACITAQPNSQKAAPGIRICRIELSRFVKTTHTRKIAATGAAASFLDVDRTRNVARPYR